MTQETMFLKFKNIFACLLIKVFKDTSLIIWLKNDYATLLYENYADLDKQYSRSNRRSEENLDRLIYQTAKF